MPVKLSVSSTLPEKLKNEVPDCIAFLRRNFSERCLPCVGSNNEAVAGWSRKQRRWSAADVYRFRIQMSSQNSGHNDVNTTKKKTHTLLIIII